MSQWLMIMVQQDNPVFKLSDEVYKKTEAWRRKGGFKHRNPCKEWLRGKRCLHYAKARYRHFKPDIDKIVSTMFLG